MDLQAQLDALDAAIASGIKVTQFDGHRMEYQSMDDMMKARSALAARIAGANAGGRRTHFNPAYDSGF